MRVKDADAIEIGIYYEALSSLPIERVRQAAEQWMQTGGRFFPTTAEWCTLAREMRDAVPRASWAPKMTVDCETCSDTGFSYRDCVAGQRCGKESCLVKGADWSHVYVVRCACFTSEQA